MLFIDFKFVIPDDTINYFEAAGLKTQKMFKTLFRPTFIKSTLRDVIFSNRRFILHLDHLLPQGDLFVSVDGNGKETVTQSDSVCVKVPMAVIVNGNTYSAAEFFAAALQEYDWATIVGQNTTGKGRSQTTIALPDGSAVHISSRKYLTPNRVDLSEQGGLVPDVVVAPAADSDVDAQLEAAIAALR